MRTLVTSELPVVCHTHARTRLEVQPTRAEQCVCRRLLPGLGPRDLPRDLRVVTRLLLSLALSLTLAMLTPALALTLALILASP